MRGPNEDRTKPEGGRGGDAITRQEAATPPGSIVRSAAPADTQDRGTAPPGPGRGHDLARLGPSRAEVEAMRRLQQLDTPLGRVEAKQDATLEKLSRIEELLGAATTAARGRPVDDRYKLIEDYHALVAEAVRALVLDDPTRTGLLGTLDAIKRKIERSLAMRRHSAPGSNPLKVLGERKRRERKKQQKNAAT